MCSIKIKASMRPFLGLSLYDAQQRLTGRQYHTYFYLWLWSAPRFSEPHATKHERFWKKVGRLEYYKRINKVRAACGYKLIPLSDQDYL